MVPIDQLDPSDKKHARDKPNVFYESNLLKDIITKEQ